MPTGKPQANRPPAGRVLPDGPRVTRDTPLGGIMVREVITIQLHDRASVVDALMRLHPIHHLPVLDGEVLVGLVTQRDLFRTMLSTFYYGQHEREQQDFLDNFTDLAGIMTRDPLTLTPEDTVGEALELMLEYRIGCVPIVNGRNALLGIVTDSDLLRLFRVLLDEEQG